MKNYSGIIIENNATSLGSLSIPSEGYAQPFKLPNNYLRGQVVPDFTGFQLFVESETDNFEIDWALEYAFNKRNEVQQIHLNSLPSDKNYRLSFLNAVSDNISYFDSDEDLQEKLAALDTVKGNIRVSGRTITFINSLSKRNVDMLKVVAISGYDIKGEWDPSGSYLEDDVVSRIDKNYRAIQSSTNQDPLTDTEGVYWEPTVSVAEAIPAYEWRELTRGTQPISLISKEGKGWADVSFDAKIDPDLIFEQWRIRFKLSDNAKICFSSFQTDKGELTRINEFPVLALNRKASAIYRVMGATLDEGIDSLGNSFRSALKIHRPTSVLSTGNSLWMSQPNPSKFAVEALYFDVRQNNQSSVINKVLIDPTTPGVVCNIYYSTDDRQSSLGNNSFDMLLWTPALTNLKLTNKYTFNFPSPIIAKYIKLEFTQLQARSYLVGTHQSRITYRKHPKWVLDYFYRIYEYEKAKEPAADQVTLRYNALDLYYNYFIDDIVESSIIPRSINKSITTNVLNEYLASATQEEVANLDTETLRNIKAGPFNYEQNPLVASVPRNRLGALSLISRNLEDYSTELVSPPSADLDLVSTLDRSSVQMDREFPAMSFYINSRHAYRISKAKFENDKAYFAGVKQVAFQRDYYASVSDQFVYSEVAGDNLNIETNDLQLGDGVWTGRGNG